MKTISPKFVLSIVCISLSLLTGCVGPRQASENWPQSLPPLEFYKDVYYADQKNQPQQTLNNYLRWVRNFYQGFELYRQGWNDFVPQVLADVEDPQKRSEVERQLYYLGRDISGEWGKYDEKRLIRTRHLSVWGNAMRTAMATGDVLEIINEVEQDVEALLNRTLDPDEINADRYYEQDKDDAFRF